MPIIPQARLTVIAEFPKQYFLENLAVRSDGSILVTATLAQQQAAEKQAKLNLGYTTIVAPFDGTDGAVAQGHRRRRDSTLEPDCTTANST